MNRVKPLSYLLAVVTALVVTGCSSYQPLALPDESSGVQVEDWGKFLYLPAVSRREAGQDGGASAGGGRSTSTGGIPVGLVFYPGGLVEPEAYLTMLAPVAAAGYPVVVVRFPFDLAVVDYDRAERVLRELDSRGGLPATSWAIAGHSLGGAMAARFVGRNVAGNDESEFAGLILMAAYPPGSDDLSRSELPVLSIWASNDGLATPGDREETAPLLPRDTRYVVIQGGNHAGFGEYGPQKDDGQRTIPLAGQHGQITDEVVRFLGRLP